jgi:hypothetical protein
MVIILAANLITTGLKKVNNCFTTFNAEVYLPLKTVKDYEL